MTTPSEGLIDTHCHLDLLTVGVDEALEEARACGVGAVVTVGIDVASSVRAVETAHRHEGVYATVGLHPHDAAACDDRVLDELERLASSPAVVAVGETAYVPYISASPFTNPPSSTDPTSYTADPGVRNPNLYPGYTTQNAPTGGAAEPANRPMPYSAETVL